MQPEAFLPPTLIPSRDHARSRWLREHLGNLPQALPATPSKHAVSCAPKSGVVGVNEPFDNQKSLNNRRKNLAATTATKP